MTLTQEEREICNQYGHQFGNVPIPIGVPMETILDVLRKALEDGLPVPDNYDWLPEIPEEAFV